MKTPQDPEAAETVQTTEAPAVAPAATCSEFLSTLIERMDGHDAWSITGIVDAADVKGQRQECEWFGHEYVDQRGPGIMGDDYSGDIFIPLEGRYLKLWYSC